MIINGVECEPYITADYRLMMEHADEILVGLELLMKAAKVNKGYIGIEDNKPAAIELFEQKTEGRSDIEIVPLSEDKCLHHQPSLSMSALLCKMWVRHSQFMRRL